MYFDFILTNSVVSDATFHLRLHCLLKYPFRGFGSTKELIENLICLKRVKFGSFKG